MQNRLSLQEAKLDVVRQQNKLLSVLSSHNTIAGASEQLSLKNPIAFDVRLLRKFWYELERFPPNVFLLNTLQFSPTEISLSGITSSITLLQQALNKMLSTFNHIDYKTTFLKSTGELSTITLKFFLEGEQ